MAANFPSSLVDTSDTEKEEVARTTQVPSVHVDEAPVRLWHWIEALAIVTLGLTGYLIGAPLPSQPGKASANFLMGYIRFTHFAAGYVPLVGLLGRLDWALVGNHHARELFTLPIMQWAHWREVGAMAATSHPCRA